MTELPDEIPECASCEEAVKDYKELEKVVDDLAQLVKRLAHALKKSTPNNDLPKKALDYLRREQILGEPMRDMMEAGLGE